MITNDELEQLTKLEYSNDCPTRHIRMLAHELLDHRKLKLVGWQQRYLDKDEGPTDWQFCDARTAEILRPRLDYELRPVYAKDA